MLSWSSAFSKYFEIHDMSESLGRVPTFSWLDGSMPRLRSNFSGSIWSRISLQQGPRQCNLEGAARTLGQESVACSLPSRLESRLQTDGCGGRLAFEVLHDMAIS